MARERRLTSLKHVCGRDGLSFPTGAKATETLVPLGIAHEVTGRRRSRVFAYERYMNIPD